jgi:hypothetical protein
MRATDMCAIHAPACGPMRANSPAPSTLESARPHLPTSWPPTEPCSLPSTTLPSPNRTWSIRNQSTQPTPGQSSPTPTPPLPRLPTPYPAPAAPASCWATSWRSTSSQTPPRASTRCACCGWARTACCWTGPWARRGTTGLRPKWGGSATLRRSCSRRRWTRWVGGLRPRGRAAPSIAGRAACSMRPQGGRRRGAPAVATRSACRLRRPRRAAGRTRHA